MKIKLIIPLLLLFAGLIFSSCDVNNEDSPTLPGIEGEVEIGLGNNGIGIIGEDFHLEMDVIAGDLLESVQVKLEQREAQTYSHDWSFEITWDQYAGVKNANVHKHFDIPEDAAEGEYDFIIVVNDQNGSQLEEVRTITLYHPENLPVNPQLEIFSVSKNYDFFYRNGDFLEGNQVAKNDTLSAQATIGGVKGDGKMYLLLIKKSLNHRPETIDGIDFSKVVVYDVFEHENEEQAFSFSNAVYDFDTFTWVRRIPNLVIGAANDNNAPQPTPVDGEKAWANGEYYFGVVYTNITHNMSFYHYIEFEITGF